MHYIVAMHVGHSRQKHLGVALDLRGVDQALVVLENMQQVPGHKIKHKDQTSAVSKHVQQAQNLSGFEASTILVADLRNVHIFLVANCRRKL